MGDSLKAIYDDIMEYQALCQRYGEKVQMDKDAYGNPLVNCYGEHARALKRRRREEFEQERKKNR